MYIQNMSTKVQKWGNPVKKTVKKVTLKELVKDINPNNRHEETDWGFPVGREIW